MGGNDNALKLLRSSMFRKYTYVQATYKADGKSAFALYDACAPPSANLLFSVDEPLGL